MIIIVAAAVDVVVSVAGKPAFRLSAKYNLHKNRNEVCVSVAHDECLYVRCVSLLDENDNNSYSQNDSKYGYS